MKLGYLCKITYFKTIAVVPSESNFLPPLECLKTFLVVMNGEVCYWSVTLYKSFWSSA